MRRVLFALLLHRPLAAATGIACPDRLPEVAPDGVERGGFGAGRGAQSALRAISVIDGVPGNETAGAPRPSWRPMPPAAGRRAR